MNIFALMVKRPWPFLVVIPIILIIFTAVGWTRDDIIEDYVYNIWTPTRTEFSRDKAYARSLDKAESLTSTFAGMAVARDGGNLFTADRLEAIRARMEKVEATTVEYKGNTFTIEDVCAFNNVGALGTTYKFPCLRLSVMDLFEEARFYFEENDRVTFYQEIVRTQLVKPRVPRFGIMTQVCTSSSSESSSGACDYTVALRTNATFAEEEGFSPSYANPLLLLDDVGSMEMNHPCRVCIEEKFEATMEQYTSDITKLFEVLSIELKRATLSRTVSEADMPVFEALTEQMDAITVDRTAVEEWYFYYTIRTLYVELGAGPYATTYANFMVSDDRLQFLCTLALGNATLCPLTVTPEEARQHLSHHADNTFSSATTAGAPFPFWSQGGEALFAGTFPVSGSGVDMSGTVQSAATYLDLDNFGAGMETWSPLYSGGYIEPLSSAWAELVETDPIYRWFVAGVTNMTAHCGNGNLTGTNVDAIVPGTDALTAEAAGAITPRWCNKYSVPFEQDETRTQQFFAKMWFDLLVDSESFLGVTQGVNTPYDWTTGNGCDYSLGGTREPYTGRNESSILFNASRILYNIDEGVSAGAVNRNSIMGGVTPPVGEYSKDNPLQEVLVVQNIYPILIGEGVPDRVRNCNRPGGPLDLTEGESKELLAIWKEAFEHSWTEGWDDPSAGEVQFIGFFDDIGGVGGTTGRLLHDITLDNGKLTAISIILIAVFSAIFLFSFDVIESRALLTLVGVGLVILSFFSALGLGILCGIKISVNIAWTLPFIILGIGVDDMYIVLLSLKRTGSFTEENFVESMTEVIIPVAMTSLVNMCMFATMQFVDIPAVALTAQMALIAVIFLFLTVIFSFPAYCYLDMKRQAAGRYDCLVCLKKEGGTDAESERGEHISWLYTAVYKRLVLGKSCVTVCVRALVALATAALIGVGIYGITQREIGLGFADFFPASTQAHVWATEAEQSVSAWGIGMRWGEENYQDPDTQLFIIRQFEQVVETPNVAQIDTKYLWLASFNVWMSRQCTSNFNRNEADVLECGRDQVFPMDNTTCAGYWASNKYGAWEKNFGDGEQCLEFEGGICRQTSQMHPDDLVDMADLGIDSSSPGASWCPVFEGFSDKKLQFCLQRWHNFTGGGGNLIQHDDTKTPNPTCEGEYYNDAVIDVPLLYSAGPNFFANNLRTHEDYVDLIEETRAVCDDVDRVRCWLTGIPYNYWEQYLYIEAVLLQTSLAAVGVGLGVSWIFLFIKLKREGNHSTKKLLCGSLFGALLIAMTCAISLVAVVGISALVNVNLTAFSVMSYLLSIGFAIEYSVHVIHRYMNAPLDIRDPTQRVEYAMSFLTLPTFMSFISSTIGVVCLAFTEFEFNYKFFFQPLLTVMFVTYFVGCWFLPVFLAVVKIKALNCGAAAAIPDDLVLHEEKGSLDESSSVDKDPSVAVEIEQPSPEQVEQPAPDALGDSAKDRPFS